MAEYDENGTTANATQFEKASKYFQNVENEFSIAKITFAIFVVILVFVAIFGDKDTPLEGRHKEHQEVHIPLYHQTEKTLNQVPYAFKRQQCIPKLDIDTKKFHSKVTKYKQESWDEKYSDFAWVYVCNYANALDAINHAERKQTAEVVECVAKFAGTVGNDCEPDSTGKISKLSSCKKKTQFCGVISDPYDPMDKEASKQRWRAYLQSKPEYKSDVEQYMLDFDRIYHAQEL